MKTATIPSLRVDPELRAAAESVLQKGESLSSFVEEAIRAGIERRRMQDEFIARGLASREAARLGDGYVSSGSVLKDLDRMLAKAEKKTKAG